MLPQLFILFSFLMYFVLCETLSFTIVQQKVKSKVKWLHKCVSFFDLTCCPLSVRATVLFRIECIFLETTRGINKFSPCKALGRWTAAELKFAEGEA